MVGFEKISSDEVGFASPPLDSLTFRQCVPLLSAMLGAILLFVASATPGLAADIRTGDRIVVGPNETVNDDLYAFGSDVDIQGTVTGDLIAAANGIVIRGTVAGDLIAAGNSVTIPGSVGGSIRVAGRTVDVAGPIGEDALAAGADLTFEPQARIGRDLMFGSSSATVAAPVGRNVLAAAESVTLSGPVGGSVRAQVGSLRLADGAAIQGDLSYTSGREAIIEPGATVGGTIARTEGRPAPAEPTPLERFGAAAADWLRNLIGISLLGVPFVLLFPGFSRRAAETVGHSPWASLGLGFGLLVGIPIAAMIVFVLGLFIGGWYLGLLALALYGLALGLGYVVSALFVGWRAATALGRNLSLVVSLLFGLVLLSLVGLVPIVGGLTIFLAITFGLGALALALAGGYRRPREAPPATVTATRVEDTSTAAEQTSPQPR